MEECIKREIGGREPDQVESLMLDQAKCNDGLAHLAPFENLSSLSMNDASISSLSSMPALNKLVTLKLSDNKIKNGLDSLTKLSALERLYLGGNQIPDIESLDPLNKLSKLKWLDLEGNPVTRVPRYTEKVFELITSLEVLDGCNREGEKLEDASDDDEVLPCPSPESRTPVSRAAHLGSHELGGPICTSALCVLGCICVCSGHEGWRCCDLEKILDMWDFQA
jgi:Leucine-rich repeat (LRR) protein